MHLLQHRFTRVIRTVPVLAILALGCSESSGPREGSDGTEFKAVTMGGFFINTAPVTTNQDGQSTNIVDDYVLPAQLPNVNFEAFTIHLMAPTSPNVVTTVDNISVRVQRIDGSRSSNVFQRVAYEGEQVIAGQRYDMYQIDAQYNGAAITKANFANVTFEMDLTYENDSGATLTSRDVTLSVYQRQ